MIAAAGARLVRLRPARSLPLRGAAVGVLVAAVAFDRGGYFPGSWGWTTVAAAWVASAELVRGRADLSKAAATVAALLAAYVLWTGLSLAWTLDRTQTALETQRVAVYFAVFLAFAFWVAGSAEALVVATWAAISLVCCWSLLTRLVPDRFGVDYVGSGNRLSAPIGYWNALGIFAAAGTVLALALAAESRRALRPVAAATLPILLTTLYFTYSRGAWLCLGVGLLVLAAATARRTRLAAVLGALAPLGALAVWRASVARPLTVANPSLQAAAHDGHRLVVVLLLLASLSAVAATLLSLGDARLALTPRLLLPARIAFGALVVAVVVAATVAYGSPSTIAQKGWHAFEGSGSSGETLNGRLFSFSGTGRVGQWRVAWREVQAHPLLGSGARTYQIYWYRARPSSSRVRDVHNLYLQTLAELGPVGLVLLLAALAVPLAAGVAARTRPLVAAALGAYAVYLVHAIVDWDWELTGVMLPMLVCAAVLTSASPRRLGFIGRRVVLAGVVVLALGGAYTIAARLPMDRLSHAISKQQWAQAANEAQTASDLAPWSSEPWIALGEAELTAGLTPQAQDAFRRAVRADPRNWVAWWDLARSTGDGEHVDALLHTRLLNPRAPKAPSPGA